jgi:beta-galactosidase
MPVTSTPARLLFGGDYNPEQWPRDVWAEDMELMRRAGVDTVTIGVFSWALLEPREGEFDAGWLDDVVAMLDDAVVHPPTPRRHARPGGRDPIDPRLA